MKRYLSVAVILVALGGAGAVFAVTNDSSPTTPPWVRSDGTVDFSQVPDEFEVSGAGGKVVVCPNGKALKVRKELLFGPPPRTPAELRQATPETRKDFVWGCGKGPNGHQNPVMLPAGG